MTTTITARLVLVIAIVSACTSLGRAVTVTANDSGARDQPVAITRQASSSGTAVAEPQDRSGMVLMGAIYADKGPLNFEMFLKRDGENLTGSYYYLRSGSANKLVLKGKIGSDNKFIIEEFDSTGKQTGEFTGKWDEGPNEAGVSLEGE